MFTVFLVDDDALILEELIEQVLWMENGFEVIGSGTDPAEAIPHICELEPDVVFCDLKMPGMDGNELIRNLRERGLKSEYVMISAYDSFENVREFFHQTGYDYILKPARQDDIQMVLEGLSARLSTGKSQTTDEIADETDNPAFNQLMNYVREHYTERITLSQLSENYGFSRNYICGLFQKYHGKSLNRYLTELRMKKAKELLSDKTMLVKEVAFRSGYPDYYHFFKVFKNYYGVSPKEMRGYIDCK